MRWYRWGVGVVAVAAWAGACEVDMDGIPAAETAARGPAVADEGVTAATPVPTVGVVPPAQAPPAHVPSVTSPCAGKPAGSECAPSVCASGKHVVRATCDERGQCHVEKKKCDEGCRDGKCVDDGDEPE